MNVINEYNISELDLSQRERYILEHGTLRTVNKKEYLLKQNDRNGYIGFISRGMFCYTCIDNLPLLPLAMVCLSVSLSFLCYR